MSNPIFTFLADFNSPPDEDGLHHWMINDEERDMHLRMMPPGDMAVAFHDPNERGTHGYSLLVEIVDVYDRVVSAEGDSILWFTFRELETSVDLKDNPVSD
ncbi:MAG: hypothetical protein ACRC5T_04360 [Cetobacterium sp.]